MKAPKSVKECRTFCGMVNFLSTFCKNLRQLLIPIYELTKKHACFVWTDKHQKAFEEIKQLLVKPPVLRMVSGNRFFRLESDTSRTAAGATFYQWQNNEWVLVGYHSKRLPDVVCNYGVTELELTGLLANIHGFEQKFRQDYIGPLAIDTKIDDTHYLLKDVMGRALPGDYHINCIKRLADTYEQLQTQIGLPNDACANSQRSSVAQL